MTENQWTQSVCDLLLELDIGQGIHAKTLMRVPYAREITAYKLDFTPKDEKNTPFETDLLIYEENDQEIKPRVIVEAKLGNISTHDAITYSYKAQSHKNVTPFLRYGIMIGGREHYPLPGRLFRHGAHFDFMISFKGEGLEDKERDAFAALLVKEIDYSRKLEEMLYNSRNKYRERYFLMQKELRLEKLE